MEAIVPGQNSRNISRNRVSSIRNTFDAGIENTPRFNKRRLTAAAGKKYIKYLFISALDQKHCQIFV